MKNTGITLLEILIVVVILGILAGIVTAKVSWAAAEARDAVRAQDLATLDRQLEYYRVQHGDTYPWEWEDVGEDLMLVIEQLLSRTNEYGEVMPVGGNPRKYKYGPYLDKFPSYLFVKGGSPGDTPSFDDVVCFDYEPDLDYGAAPPPPMMGDSPSSGGGGGSSTTSSAGGAGSGRGRLRSPGTIAR